MRKFSDNTCVARSSKYIVQCTPRGRTVYVYNSNENEIAKFQDMKHTYQCLISPDETHFVLLSLCGTLGIYSTEEMKLIKKVRYGSVDQDGGFCFSNDGKKLYVIEHVCKNSRMYSRLISYNTFSYDKKHVEFERLDIELLSIAPTKNNDELLLLGYKRNREGFGFLNFMTIFKQSQFLDIKYTRDLPSILRFTDWSTNNYEKMIQFFNTLPNPKSPFEFDLNVVEQWDIMEMICDVIDRIIEHKEIAQVTKDVKTEYNKPIFESEYEISKQKIYDKLDVLNTRIYSLGKKSPFDPNPSKMSIDNIYEVCNSLLNCFLGV